MSASMEISTIERWKVVLLALVMALIIGSKNELSVFLGNDI